MLTTTLPDTPQWNPAFSMSGRRLMAKVLRRNGTVQNAM
jgi:hypothetical protein